MWRKRIQGDLEDVEIVRWRVASENRKEWKKITDQVVGLLLLALL